MSVQKLLKDSEKKIKKLGHTPFKPLPFIQNGMAQTLASAFWPHTAEREIGIGHTIELEDGDQLRVIEDRPFEWANGDRVVLLVHGLAGHHRSNYMVRISRKLKKSGFLVLRVNLRGCGPGFGMAKKPYHSGRSEDLRTVLRWAAKQFVGSPVTQVGFSLGANITLKLAGEDGGSPTGNLDSIVAISAPLDLTGTATHLRKSKHKIFDQFFVWKLRYDIARHHRQYPELPPAEFPIRMALTDLDDLYTAPRSGFKDAQDYYTQSSCGQFIDSIKVRGLILCAQDDPIINAESYSNLKFPTQLDLIMTPQGGHVAFIGPTAELTDVQWMDSLIVKWVKANCKNA